MNLASLISILISAFCLVLFFSISTAIMYKHSDNPDYKRSVAVKWFNAVFILIAVCDLVVVYFFGSDLDHVAIAFFFTVRAFISVITVCVYFQSIEIFTKKEIPADQVAQIIDELKNKTPDLLESFKKLNIAQHIKEPLIEELEKINDTTNSRDN